MTNKLFTLLLTCSFVISFAQQKTLNDITTFKIKNSGSFLDSNNDVDGYYFYYEVDKLKKGKREYAIKMLDNNLNELATKSYVDDKNTYLAQSNFNNDALMFAMVNLKERQYKLVQFDKQGNQSDEQIIPVSKKEIRWLSAMMQSGNFNLLYPVDNKGFLFNYVRDNKKLGYGLKYISTDGGKSWDFNSPSEAKEILTFNPIQANEDVIVALESSKKSVLSKSIDMKVLVIDINSGKKLFERSYDKSDDPRLITNAFLTKDKKVVLLGEYFDSGDNIMTSKSLGLFSQTLDYEGKKLSDSKVDWENQIDAMMPPDSEGKKRARGYVYFHDIQKTDTGYYCIGERYRKTASAGGIALAVLSRGNSNVTQLTITDAVIFKFNDNFELQAIDNFPKGKSRAPSITDFGSPQLNAHALKSFGAFDYGFTQRHSSRDRFYAMFIDYERLKGEKNKLAFKSIIYNDGQLSEDKIYLENNDSKTKYRVLPGKLGHVLLMEYNKKKKTLDIHLEKLNID